MKTIILFRVIFGLMIGLSLGACVQTAERETKSDSAVSEAVIKTPTTPFQNIDTGAFRKKMQEDNTVILDVRTAAETQSGMIEGAIHIDISQADFQEKIGRLDKGKTYLVYCKSGGRSSRACNEMAQLGFDSLFNLEGGYLGWSEE